jgi:HAD superfamily hydrolase (TIGR01450 family)
VVSQPAAVREALAGVRGLVLDADGVIVLKGELLPGAPEALARLTTLGIPFRIVTNFSSAHRDTLSARFAGGMVPGHRFITAASAAASYTACHHAGGRLFVLSSPDALREFEGQILVSADEADDAAPGDLAAVVLGDGGDELSYRNLDVAFRAIRRGAEFIAMHRNPWWLTPRGETLDAGAFVAGLEVATGRAPITCGKPSPVVFRQALAGLASDLGLRRIPARDAAMVGDDPQADIAGARRVGMRGVLVLTGKVDAGSAEAAMSSGARSRPNAIAASLVDVVAALD